MQRGFSGSVGVSGGPGYNGRMDISFLLKGLVLGVFAGSAAWWLLLSGLVGLLRDRLDARALQWLNRISGLVLFGFGLWSLMSLFSAWSG